LFQIFLKDNHFWASCLLAFKKKLNLKKSKNMLKIGKAVLSSFSEEQKKHL